MKTRIVVAAAAEAFALAAQAQAPKSLKMQSTWPASNTLQEHFKMFAERVDKLTQGGLKIEAMPAGQIVPPFEVLDATNKKVLDGWHAISYYWVGKNPAAALFAAGRDCGEEANIAKMLASEATWHAADACLQTHGGFGFAREYDVERKWRDTRLFQIAPISTNLILSYIGEHVLGMPRSY